MLLFTPSRLFRASDTVNVIFPSSGSFAYSPDSLTDDETLKKVVGHIPLYWSKLAFKFLQFQNHIICVAVTGKRVNRGADLGLEIPVTYFFYGDGRVIAWLKNSIEKLDRCIDEKVSKCVKQIATKYIYFSCF